MSITKPTKAVTAVDLDSFERTRRNLRIGKDIAVIAGVVVAIAGIYGGNRQLTIANEQLMIAAEGQQLVSLDHVKALIEEDEKQKEDIKKTRKNWKLFHGLRRQYSGLADAIDAGRIPYVISVGHHYEALGTFIQKGYIDFKLVYEIISFPDGFWDATAEVRDWGRTNFRNGKGLPDFWKNFEWLRTRYYEQRTLDAKTSLEP